MNEQIPVVAPNNERFIANEFKDITNYISDFEFRKIVVDTLNEIYSILMDHAGDKATHAMIISETGTDFEPNIFTKDGIKILDSVEFVSPIQRYIKNIITYVGKKVDSAAHDGTTTSMLLMCGYLMDAIQDLENISVNTVKFRNQLQNLYDRYMEVIDKNSMTVDKTNLVLTEQNGRQTDQHIMGFIGFMQGLSSSGGDGELAYTVARVMESTPREVLNQIRITTSVTEQKRRFIFHEEQANFTLFSNPLIDNIYNKKIGTEFEVENATVLVYPDNLHSAIPETDAFIRFINGFDINTPLVIISGVLPAEVIKTIEISNLSRTYENKITAFSDLNSSKSPYANLMFAESIAIALTAGIVPFGQDNTTDIESHHLFTAKKVTFAGTELRLFDYYEADTNLHPYYLDKTKSIRYTHFLEDLDKVIEVGGKHHVNYKGLIDRAFDIKNQMTMVRVPTVYVGGTTTDNISNRLVLMDALGAATESINKGYLTSGILHVRDNVSIYPIMESNLSEIVNLIYSSPVNQYLDPHVGINSRYPDKMITLNDIYQVYLTFREKIGNEEDVDYHGYLLEAFKEKMEIDSLDVPYPPVQPITIYDECLKRLVEIGSKLLTTNRVIVPKGAFVESPE